MKYFLVLLAFCGLSNLQLEAQSYDIVWKDVAGCSVSGNSLTKTAGTAWGNAGAGSVNRLQASTDGWIEMTIQETSTYRLLGLSTTNPDNNYASINYAIYPHVGGVLRVFENGSNKGTFGSYISGDVLRIERTGTTITYKKNGSIFYTSGISSSSDLIADAALYSPQATINNVKASFSATCDTDADEDGICADQDCNDNDPNFPMVPNTPCDDGNAATTDDVIQPDGCTCAGSIAGNGITWTNAAGVNVAGNSLTKTASTAWGNAGASSVEVLAANTDGWIEMTIQETSTYRLLGLSATNPDNNYASINYAIYPHVGGVLRVFENGANKGTFGTYVNGDKLKIERIGTTIYYKKNGSIFYASGTSSSTSLIADAALYSPGATIYNVNYSFGESSGGCDPAVGTACDDGNASTTGETIQSDCSCGGGTTSGCDPAVGTACDDGNASTTGETIQSDCSCGGGTPVSTGSSVFIDDDSSDDGAVRYSGGKVIIGASGTNKGGDYKLYVEGGILTELAKVSVRNSASWSDYVFDKDYKLNKIEEVAQFIEENQHLPNVPSADEVAAEGIDVAKMDATLLRQIEELWLHLIELKKENEELKSRLDKINK